MLVFDRPSFKKGVLIIKDRDADGKIVKKMLSPIDNGVEMEFMDEAFVKGQYPEWAMGKAEHAQKKSKNKKDKVDRKPTRA